MILVIGPWIDAGREAMNLLGKLNGAFNLTYWSDPDAAQPCQGQIQP